MSGFAIEIERSHGVPVERLESTDTRELDRAAMFGCIGQHLSGRQDLWRAALSCRDSLDEVRFRLAQRRQLDAIGQHDGSAKRRDQDTTQLRNRTGIQADGGGFVPRGIRQWPKSKYAVA
jgi:hypothetical protein